MDLTELYQDLILDHGKKPRNFGKCNKFNHDAEGHNPLCGDNIHVYLILDTDKKVKDISFEGSGCAISVASSSIMTEIVKGKSEKQARELLNLFFKMIKEGQEIGDVKFLASRRNKQFWRGGQHKHRNRGFLVLVQYIQKMWVELMGFIPE